MINEAMFREYDIRGLAETELAEQEIKMPFQPPDGGPC